MNDSIPPNSKLAHELKVHIHRVEGIRLHPKADRLTLVKLSNHEAELIANMRDDGTWRYAEGDHVALLPVNSLLPEWLLKVMGYWKLKDDKGKGMLGGNKGNRVTARTFVEIESRGALLPCARDPETGAFTLSNETETRTVVDGDEVSGFLGTGTYVPA